MNLFKLFIKPPQPKQPSDWVLLRELDRARKVLGDDFERHREQIAVRQVGDKWEWYVRDNRY